MSSVKRELDTAPAWNRRALLGTAGSSLTLAASGLLLPESVIAATDASDLTVRHVPQEANNRRRRRRHRHAHHRHGQQIRALAAVALSGSQVIPSNTQTTLHFDVGLSLLHFQVDSSASRLFPEIFGIYDFELFLTWSGSRDGVCATRLAVNDSYISDDRTLFTSAPTIVRIVQTARLREGDSIQVLGQQDTDGEAQVSAGAMAITMLSTD
jgi:hypothetical protein